MCVSMCARSFLRERQGDGGRSEAITQGAHTEKEEFVPRSSASTHTRGHDAASDGALTQ